MDQKKILIVEDEVVLGEILLNKLKEEGFDAIWELDGEAGLAKVREWRPDLILLDIVMPKMDGYEVLEAISNDEELKKIPVVIISNSGQPVELTRILQLGAKDYIIKTEFGPDEVLAKVRKYIDSNEHVEGEVQAQVKGIKILIVEDDTFLSTLAADRMMKEGYTVSVAPDGMQALKLLEADIPDLMLLDIIMPGMNGFEVLKQVKENPKWKDVSIIIFSNLGQEHEIEEARKLGADDFLVKAQFTLKEVIVKMNELLKKKGKIK